MGEEKEVQAQETNSEEKVNTAPSLIANNRAKFEEQFETVHEQTDSQESESEEVPVTEPQSDSSSVKEEVKGGEQPEVKVDKTDELLKNKEKALHEEREKRKQANLKLRELQRQYDEKLKALEEKLNTVAAPKAEIDEPINADPKIMARLQALEAEKRQAEMERQQAEFVEKQKKLQEEISKTDKSLKEEGFPGFRYGVNRVDEELKHMFAEGEIDEADYLDPKLWAEVYKTKVYEEVASEFKAKIKEETLESRINKKKEAAKVTGNPGSKPEVKKESNDEEPETDSISEYLALRKKHSAKTGR